MSKKWNYDQINDQFVTITDPEIRRYVEGAGESGSIQLRTFYRQGHQVAALFFSSELLDVEITNETNVDLHISLREKEA